MKKIVVFLALMLMQSVAVYSQNYRSQFDDLNEYNRLHPPVFPTEFQALSCMTFLLSSLAEGVKLHYHPYYSKLLTPEEKEAYGKYMWEGDLGPTERLLKARIDKDSDIWYFIHYGAGPSVDPHFAIYRAVGDSSVFIGMTPPSLDIFLPGDGFIYTSGHVDNDFNQRRIYKIKEDELIEIQQPYYYVGLETVTTDSLTLKSLPNLNNGSLTLPKGTPITVLLNRDNDYLIKTQFGITGWVRRENTSQLPIKHLFFRGD